jgi:hypothetical protein
MKNKHENQHKYNFKPVPAFEQKFLIEGIDVKSWQLRKSKATYFPSKVEQVVKFLEGDEKMMMIRDENGDDSCL